METSIIKNLLKDYYSQDKNKTPLEWVKVNYPKAKDNNKPIPNIDKLKKYNMDKKANSKQVMHNLNNLISIEFIKIAKPIQKLLKASKEISDKKELHHC